MITAAFDMALWTVLFFVVGMIKPKWPLFFLKKPDRFLIVAITTILIMITFTLWGEGKRQAKAEQDAKTAPPTVAPTPASAPVPVPQTQPAAPAAPQK